MVASSTALRSKGTYRFGFGEGSDLLFPACKSWTRKNGELSSPYRAFNGNERFGFALLQGAHRRDAMKKRLDHFVVAMAARSNLANASEPVVAAKRQEEERIVQSAKRASSKPLAPLTGTDDDLPLLLFLKSAPQLVGEAAIDWRAHADLRLARERATSGGSQPAPPDPWAAMFPPDVKLTLGQGAIDAFQEWTYRRAKEVQPVLTFQTRITYLRNNYLPWSQLIGSEVPENVLDALKADALLASNVSPLFRMAPGSLMVLLFERPIQEALKQQQIEPFYRGQRPAKATIQITGIRLEKIGETKVFIWSARLLDLKVDALLQ